jgi:hypothetical protein
MKHHLIELGHRSSWAIFILSFFLLFSLGCASVTRIYDGPKVPPEKVARLTVGGGLFLEAIDGQTDKRHRNFIAPFATTVARVELLPGGHLFKVSCFVGRVAVDNLASVEDELVIFTLDAGQSYRMSSRHDNKTLTWFIVIQNEETKEVILEEGPYTLVYGGNTLATMMESGQKDREQRMTDRIIRDTLRGK